MNVTLPKNNAVSEKEQEKQLQNIGAHIFTKELDKITGSFCFFVILKCYNMQQQQLNHREPRNNWQTNSKYKLSRIGAPQETAKDLRSLEMNAAKDS